MFADCFDMNRYSAFTLCVLLTLLAGALSAQTVTSLKNKLKRAGTKSERMQLSYQIAEKQLARSPAEAATYAYKASELAVQLGEKRMASDALYLSGNALYRRRKYTEASRRFSEAWHTARNYGHRETALQAAEKLKDIGKAQRDMGEALKWSEEMIKYLKENTGRSSNSGSALRRMEAQLDAVKAENKSLREQLTGATGTSDILETSYQQQIRKVQAQTQEELIRRDSQVEMTQRVADSLAKEKGRLMQTMRKEQLLDSLFKAQKEREIETQKAEIANAKLAQRESEAIRNALIMVSSFIFIIAGLFYLGYRAKRRTANELSDKNKAIKAEQEKSDKLLLNILPEAIATELKTKEKVAAHKYDNATVMFVDITGFTRLSELLSPEDLVATLDHNFTNFDRIIGKYKIEKIKTVGDAYICASGLSDMNASPTDMIKAALQIQDFLQGQKAAHLNQGLPFFEARAGIHTGPVVAGVVGEKKFAYDIWGDTVNVAARMEQTCEPGRVNISEDTYWKAKYEFEWEPRGKIAAKNKGMLDMYYVTGVKDVENW